MDTCTSKSFKCEIFISEIGKKKAQLANLIVKYTIARAPKK